MNDQWNEEPKERPTLPGRSRDSASVRGCLILLLAAAGAGACGADDQPPLAGDGERPALAPLAEMVRTPHGLRHRSCVHQVPSGAHVNHTGDVTVDGIQLAHYDDCAAPSAAADASGETPQPSVTGTLIAAAMAPPPNPVNANGAWFSAILATWTVPDFPGTGEDGQTVFLWPGLESRTTAPDLLQPVLQFGPSDAGHTTGSWAISAWALLDGGDHGGGHSYFSGMLPVNPGEKVTGEVYLLSRGPLPPLPGIPQLFIYDYRVLVRRNLTNQAVWIDTSIVAGATSPLTRAIGGAFEVWNADSCADFPSVPTTFAPIQVFEPSATVGASILAPASFAQWHVLPSNGVPPNCPYSLTIANHPAGDGVVVIGY